MTLDDFRQLCEDQWHGPRFGDVVKLWLTSESAVELTNDVLTSEVSSDFYSLSGGVPQEPVAIGVCITKLVNPVTRTAVAVTPGNPEDTAVIHFGAHSPEELVTF
jgi:hypothetical protein